MRTDIQALRAIAVSMVLVYHLWPGALTGGFTGVDVFFVISGFLITAHLLGNPPSGPRDLAAFWSRRIRRLLPASLLVLGVTLLASRLIAPDTQWANTASQVRSAALYVVNWRLAHDSVDYLAAQAAPSPVEHFWSLSVEEQFYLIWPILILLLVAAATLLRRRRVPVVAAGLGLVVAASLAYSIHDTAVEPASAYFVTPTRIWELGAGGLLAAALAGRTADRFDHTRTVPLSPRGRVVLAWAGLAAIVAAAFAYSGGTPFPGWQAVLPVLGTVAVIAAGAPRVRASPGPALAVAPLQWLGDVSYSVYLWHFPLIALLPYVSGGKLGLLDKGVIIAVTLVLAGLTNRYVEDRFRTPQWGRPLVKPFALAAAAMAFVVGCSTLQVSEVRDRQQVAEAALHKALAAHTACFGAAAMAPNAENCPPTTTGALTPAPVQALNDKSAAYPAVSGKPDCFSNLPDFPVVKCTFGDPNSKVDVVLVGNSHAGEWIPAIDPIAKRAHWKVTTYLASRCANADVTQDLGTPAFDRACTNWTHRTTAQIVAAKPDLVIMTNRVSANVPGKNLAASQAPYTRGYLNVLTAFSKAHLPVVGIRDAPALPGVGTFIPDCLAAHTDDYTKCDGTRAEWVPPEPLTKAIAQVKDRHIVEISLLDYLCHPVVCPAAIGGVPVYFDRSHMTATFAATLAPYLEPILVKTLRG